MIHYEEKPHEGMRLSARGKVAWLDQQKIKEDAPEFLYLFKQKPTEDDFVALKDKVIYSLGKKGFVFFDKILYRYTLTKQGYLKEFGISYHYLK